MFKISRYFNSFNWFSYCCHYAYIPTEKKMTNVVHEFQGASCSFLKLRFLNYSCIQLLHNPCNNIYIFAMISQCVAHFHPMSFVASSRTWTDHARGRVQFVCELATFANWRVQQYQQIMQLHVPYVSRACARARMCVCVCYYMQHASQLAPHAICTRVANDMCVSR